MEGRKRGGIAGRRRLLRPCPAVSCAAPARHPLAVAEAFRALAAGGRVRTIAPEDVAERVPERFFPAMAAADTERMPPLDAIEGWLRDAGFVVTERRRVLRNKKLNLADEERQLLIEVRRRYSFVSEQELDAGLRRMRAEAKMSGENWIDPRPNAHHRCLEDDVDATLMLRSRYCEPCRPVHIS